MRIYLTHCSAKKAEDLVGTKESVGPDVLYTAAPTQRFIAMCKSRKVKWAIFSDLYGVWFPDVRHEWYEKNPNHVTEQEFLRLVKNFDQSLEAFEEIVFYHNPGRFHPLYRRLVHESSIANRIRLISHLTAIR